MTWTQLVEQKVRVKPLLLPVDVPVTLAIMARTLFWVQTAYRTCQRWWLFQGSSEVVINPTEEQIAAFKAAGEAYAKQKLNASQHAQTVTADGKHFELAANIGTPKDNDNGAEAVGLYRTEFLYMDSQDFQQKMTNTKPTKLFLKV